MKKDEMRGLFIGFGVGFILAAALFYGLFLHYKSTTDIENEKTIDSVSKLCYTSSREISTYLDLNHGVDGWIAL